MAHRNAPNQPSENAPPAKNDESTATAHMPPQEEDEEFISPHPGIGGVLADPPRRTDRRGG